MKIAQIVHCLDPSHGGPPHVAMRVASALAARGHETHLIGARDPQRKEVVDDVIAGVPGIEAVHVHVTDLPRGRMGQFLKEHILAPIRDIGNVQVGHLHGIWGNDMSAAASMIYDAGGTYIARPAGMLDYWTLRQKPVRKKIALMMSTGKMLRRAGAIQALNKHEKEAIERLKLGTRLEVVPNGVFIEEVDTPTEPGAFRASQPALGDRPFVLFLSRLHYKKGLDILADAWKLFHAQHPDWALVVAGPREDDSIDGFRQAVMDNDLGDSVIESGALYGEIKTAALRECDIFALPSRQEGFSIAVTEALSLGCAAVITHECHFPEVTEAGAGIETSLDPGDFAQGLLTMAGDPALRESAGAAASQLVRDRFVWPEIASTLESLYEELLAARAG